MTSILKRRIEVHPLVLMAGTAIFIIAADNGTFWNKGAEIFAGHPVSFAGLVLAVFFLFMMLMSLFISRWLVRPAMVFFLMLSAITSYYVENLGVVFDRDMIQNVVTTTFTESKHLVTFSFVSHVVLWGVLPSLVVLWFRVRPTRFLRSVMTGAGVFVLSFALAAGLLYMDLKTYVPIFRERKDLMGSFQPGAPLVGTIRYYKRLFRARNTAFRQIGTDARKGPALAGADKPVLTLIVAGETARTQNMSANGYDRPTNRFTENLPVVSFTDVSSCGTATAVSLPCMFSVYDRASYSYQNGISTDNVLDVLSHAGVKVHWWDNNTGSKDVAARVDFKSFYQSGDPEHCGSGECIDSIFLDKVAQMAGTITEDTVVVLHLIGSHGPTYYLRYPPEFEEFKPACRSADFQNCTQQEVVNVYDNTMLYTDYILSRLIETLDAQDRVLGALLYVSDHGESLGENGLYLHGSPYMFAPETQTKVPMQVWISQPYRDRFGIDFDCLQRHRDDPLSHANLFHSILGLMDIETEVRQDELDIFAACRS